MSVGIVLSTSSLSLRSVRYVSHSADFVSFDALTYSVHILIAHLFGVIFF